MLPKILIVEDDVSALEYYGLALEGHCTVLQAASLLEARDALKANPDVALIAVDGCFPKIPGGSPYPETGRSCSGEKFIAGIRLPGVPIIACSSDPALNRKMQTVGATHTSAKCHALQALVLKLLALPAASC